MSPTRPGLEHPAHGRLRPVTPHAAVLLADNPSVMTLDGTNTWLLRAPGSADAIVVDPGPDDPVHLRAVANAAEVVVILLTHGHPDHSAGAWHLHELTGAPVRASDPAFRLGGDGGDGGFGEGRDGRGLAEGDVVAGAGLAVRVWATPGHTADSVSFLLDPGDGTRAVLTGDTVLGQGTTVVAHPDGNLADYLSSLRRLRELGGATVLPGHGRELPDAAAAADTYLAHRERRLEQVRAAVARLGSAVTPRAVVQAVYSDVDPALWPAAELSVRAQLAYLGVSA
jgi:glyoxylase-like metal-dependent hydrolase (beta-lactamase superfamily II)